MIRLSISLKMHVRKSRCKTQFSFTRLWASKSSIAGGEANRKLLIGWCLVYLSGAKTTQDKDLFGSVVSSHTGTVSAVPPACEEFENVWTWNIIRPAHPFTLWVKKTRTSSKASRHDRRCRSHREQAWPRNLELSRSWEFTAICKGRDGSMQSFGSIDSLHVFFYAFLFAPGQCKNNQSSRWQSKHVPCGVLSFIMKSKLCSNYPAYIFEGCWALCVTWLWEIIQQVIPW